MSVTGSNVLSTQDDVAAALADSGLKVYAYHGLTQEEYDRHIEMCLSHKPNIIIDDGADLVTFLHDKRPDLMEEVWGGCEETTTGVIRLKAMEREGILKVSYDCRQRRRLQASVRQPIRNGPVYLGQHNEEHQPHSRR